MLTFDEFLLRSFEKLAVYARMLAGNRHDGDDLLADALVAAQERWADIGAMDHPAAYVRRIISSRHVRSKRSWLGRNVKAMSPESLPEQVAPDPTSSVSEQDLLANHLAALPARHRAAVVLRYYLDLSYEDIGRELNVSVGGARLLAHRGIAALRLSGAGREMVEEPR